MKDSDLEGEVVPMLTKVTFGYSKYEDRVHLDGICSQGSPIRIWLTARLLNRLAPHLVIGQIDSDVELKTPAGTEPNQTSPKKVAEEPVLIYPDSEQFLVTAIDVTKEHNGFLLIFKDGAATAKAAFAIASSSLEQWNQGLRYCFQQAGWSQAAFSNADGVSRTHSHQGITIH